MLTVGLKRDSAWIVSEHLVGSTGVEKPNAELRRLIRSQCMIGKNKGRILPPRKRKPKGNLKQQDNQQHDDDATILTESLESTSTTTPPHSGLPVVAVPRKFGFSLSAIPLARNIEPVELEVILNCMLYQLACILCKMANSRI